MTEFSEPTGYLVITGRVPLFGDKFAQARQIVTVEIAVAAFREELAKLKGTVTLSDDDVGAPKVRRPRGPNKPKVAAVPHVHAAAAD